MARHPREWLILAGILCAATFVRLYRIDLTWYFLDQVRDVSTAIGIASARDFPLVGPLIGWTSGRLGPLYFYLISPPFLFTADPVAGFVFAALVNVLAVFLCYSFTRGYFGAPVALGASALFSVFPLGVFSSRVLWNPALVPLFTLLFMRALFEVVVRGRSRSTIWMCASLAVLSQLHLTTAALGVVAVLAFAVWRPRVRLIDVLAGLAAFLLLYAPYIAYELSHQFENTRAVLRGVGMDQPGTGERAFPSLLRNLLILYRPAIDGFVVTDPWPPLFVVAFSLLNRAEALLFCAGLVVGLWRLVRDRKSTTASAIAAHRSVGLLFLWLLVPVVLLGTRKTALWWYYLDLLYPSQFIFAAMALASISSFATARAWTSRTLAWGATGIALAIIGIQIWFQIGLQHRVERQGQLVFDVPKFSVASAGSSLGILPSLPYGYRARLLRTLVADFGMPPDAFSHRVHGPVLGRPDENDQLLRYLGPGAGSDTAARAPLESHYLVTMAPDGGSEIRGLRSQRIGPYALVEYRPIVDYQDWRCALTAAEGAPVAPAGSWARLALPAAGVSLELLPGKALLCEGLLRLSEGQRARLVVSIAGQAPLRVARGEIQGTRLAPVSQRSWQSPSLYWTSEAAFDVHGLRPGDETFRFEATGSGRVIGIDVYEQSRG